VPAGGAAGLVTVRFRGSPPKIQFREVVISLNHGGAQGVPCAIIWRGAYVDCCLTIKLLNSRHMLQCSVYRNDRAVNGDAKDRFVEQNTYARGVSYRRCQRGSDIEISRRCRVFLENNTVNFLAVAVKRKNIWLGWNARRSQRCYLEWPSVSTPNCQIHWIGGDQTQPVSFVMEIDVVTRDIAVFLDKTWPQCISTPGPSQAIWLTAIRSR